MLFRLRREGADVVLEIADNGVGIPPEDLGRVIRPFFTGLNGRALFPQATGMGLYLAREVCRRLGHELSPRFGPGERAQRCGSASPPADSIRRRRTS